MFTKIVGRKFYSYVYKFYCLVFPLLRKQNTHIVQITCLEKTRTNKK